MLASYSIRCLQKRRGWLCWTNSGSQREIYSSIASGSNCSREKEASRAKKDRPRKKIFITKDVVTKRTRYRMRASLLFSLRERKKEQPTSKFSYRQRTAYFRCWPISIQSLDGRDLRFKTDPSPNNLPYPREIWKYHTIQRTLPYYALFSMVHHGVGRWM